MRIVTDSSGVVTMWSEQAPNWEVPPGGGRFDLTEEQIAELTALAPTHGFTFINGVFAALPAPTAPIPATATAGDFMRALIELGHYDAIDTVINSMTGVQGKIAKVLWTRAIEFPRSDPLIAQVAAAAGMSSADIDAVYVKSATYGE